MTSICVLPELLSTNSGLSFKCGPMGNWLMEEMSQLGSLTDLEYLDMADSNTYFLAINNILKMQ